MNSETDDRSDDEQRPDAPDAAPSAAAEGGPGPEAPPDEPRKGHHEHEDAKTLRGKLKKKDHEIKGLKQELEALRTEAASLKDRFLRAAAEMDNQRKRLERDRSEYLQFAQSELLKDLLGVVDNFERALAKPPAEAEGSGFLAGIELIAKQLQDLIRKRGVTAVPSVGAPFDPTVHQAVLTVEDGDVEEAVIGEELQKGYRLHDRLLRPAMVKVRVPEKPRMKGSVVGIDLGTTYSCAAHLSGGRPRVIFNQEGAAMTPSVAAFTASGETLVGTPALRQAAANPQRTLTAVKRLMGRKLADPIIQQARARLPYGLAAAPNGDVIIEAAGRRISPPEVAALILGYIKSYSEAFLGESVRDAVITVPAHFGEAQRQATKDAAEIAGFNVLRMINEPTAASLAFGLGKDASGKAVVIDMGGGTFDVTLLEIAGGIFQILATNGDSFLGGEDFDRRIVDWALDALKREQGLDLSRDAYALQRIQEAAERAKRELSFTAETEINLPFLTSGPAGSKHFRKALTRARLEDLTGDLVDRAFPLIEKTLAEARLAPADVTSVVLVGGQTRMPLLRGRAEAFFGRPPAGGVNPDESVALGAAVQSGILEGGFEDIVLLLDVTSQSLGIEIEKDGFEKIIEKNSTIPTKRTKIFTTVENDQRQVRIHAVQGEAPLASANVSLAKFDMVGLVPGPAGSAQIEVTFEIDANGLVKVTARDAQTGREQQVAVHPSSGLSKTQVDGLAKRERSRLTGKKGHE